MLRRQLGGYPPPSSTPRWVASAVQGCGREYLIKNTPFADRHVHNLITQPHIVTTLHNFSFVSTTRGNESGIAFAWRVGAAREFFLDASKMRSLGILDGAWSSLASISVPACGRLPAGFGAAPCKLGVLSRARSHGNLGWKGEGVLLRVGWEIHTFWDGGRRKIHGETMRWGGWLIARRLEFCIEESPSPPGSWRGTPG